MAGATRSIVIDAPMEKVFDVIQDFEKYPEFVKEVKSAKVLKRNGAECEVQYKVDAIKTVQYTIRAKAERPSKLSWSYVNGEGMKDNKGSWVLESAGEGKTKATYTVEIDLGMFVPKAVVNALVDTTLPKMLDAFKQRAESR